MAKNFITEIIVKIEKESGSFFNKSLFSISILKKFFFSIPSLFFAIFAAVSGNIILAINGARRKEEATNSLARSLINQGIYTRSLFNNYSDLARFFSNESK